jgi:hypothetical protein
VLEDVPKGSRCAEAFYGIEEKVVDSIPTGPQLNQSDRAAAAQRFGGQPEASYVR